VFLDDIINDIQKGLILAEDSSLIRGEQRTGVVYWRWPEQTHDDWVVLAKSTRDAGPNWIEVVLDPGGNDLVAQNGWVWDQELEILRFADLIVFSIFTWVCTTEVFSWGVACHHLLVACWVVTAIGLGC
jgi:hypothetical protein